MNDTHYHRRNTEQSPCPACGNSFPDADWQAPSPCPGCEAWDQLQRSMRAADSALLASDAILSDLAATTKRRAVYEIVCFLAESGYLDDSATSLVTAALLRREGLASTGIGRGIAIPHAAHAAVPRSIVSIARSRTGIDFESLDGKPVRIIALALFPPAHSGEQLRVMATIARHLREFETHLRRAGGPCPG